MIDVSKDKELHGAKAALIEWFKSQDINPSSGVFIMVSLIADQLVAINLNLVELQNAANNVHKLLLLEIVDSIKSIKKKEPKNEND